MSRPIDFSRPGYFLAALWRRMVPVAHFTRRTRALLPVELSELSAEMRARIDWCCRLDGQTAALPSTRLGDMVMRKREEFYFLDLMRHAKGFGMDMRLDWRFGDVTEVPEVPALVKSRPIHGDNANSVLMPLDYLRHFNFPEDPVPFARKRAAAVFRGRLGTRQQQPARHEAVMRLHDHPRHDVGQVNARSDLPPAKDWMSIPEQLGYRYILAPEGNDVATSLKWIMNSNSVALTPPLEYETWFMEGRLVPGEHFIGLKPDYSDLDEKIDWAERHPGEVARINRNAKAWCAQFRDRRREDLAAALVLLKYIEATGGLSHSRIDRRLFFPEG